MHRRFLTDWRGVVWLAIAACLVLLPLTDALAAPRPEAASQPADAGFGPTSEEDKNLRIVRYARSNYAWPFAAGPYYGDVPAADRRAAGVVQTPVGSFQLSQGKLNFPAELMATDNLATTGVQYFILQVHPDTFESGTFESIKSAVETNGGRLMQHLPTGSFVTRMTTAAMAAVNGMPGVLAIEPYHPAFKLDPSIGRSPHADRVAAVSDLYTLELQLFQGEDAQVVAQELTNLGGNVVWMNVDTIRVEIHRTALAQVATLEPVYMIHEYHPIHALGEESAFVVQTAPVWDGIGTQAYVDAGIDGTGQVLYVMDSGITLDAGDLSNTRTTPGTPSGAHRKVLEYAAANLFGGSGDTQGCDESTGTHGHIVSATALGHASDDSVAYGGAYRKFDINNTREWDINGVAPGAKLVAYDAHVTPSVLPCAAQPGLIIGNLYTDGGAGNGRGSLGVAYDDFGARVFNLSLGTSSNVYGANSSDIDDFMFDKKDALVLVAAGNDGSDNDGDGRPDEGTLGSPATTKNGFAIGATGTATTGTGGDLRAGFTSAGPVTTSNRVAPQLMAPGTDAGALGLISEYACRSADNNQVGAVQCDVTEGWSGTSFAAPAAAGAALLVIDYFADGWYPDGTDQNPGNASDQTGISAAALKSVLIASADWVGVGNSDPPGPSSRLFRFNNEQGYGRIQLNQVLPIVSGVSPVGLIVADGETGGVNNTSLSGSVAANQTDTTTFNVCDDSQEIRVALSWIEAQGNALVHDLDLEVIAPVSGAEYWGNYFTDDNNKNRSLDALEDCPSVDGQANLYDATPWSLEVCANSVRDTLNPTEGVFLSPDPQANGPGNCSTTATEDCFNDSDCPGAETCVGNFSQIEPGDWTLNVIGRAGIVGNQAYAVAITGGVCIGSNVRFNIGNFPCNGRPTITVNETDEAGTDPASGLTPAEISSRLTLQVIDPGADGVPGGGDDTVVDTESGLTVTQPDPSALKFQVEKFLMSDGLAADPGNGALDVQDGYFIKAIYADESNGTPDPDQERTNTAAVDCSVAVQFGDLVFGQFGLDTPILVEGGCEQDALGNFEFDAPDRYMDEGELLGYRFAFTVAEPQDLVDVTASLRCVLADADSPASCRPGTTDCADPNRLNNASCTQMTILDSPKIVGDVPSNAAIAANFTIEMASAITGQPEVDMLLGVSAKNSGKTVEGLGFSRHKLDVDEFDIFYSTDFPTSGSEDLDWNSDEVLDNPTTNIADFDLHYRFEQRTYGDLTAGGRNSALDAPWNFNTTANSFTSGVGSISDTATVSDIIANWGEDQNFNGNPGGTPEAGEDRDPVNGQLDQNWGTEGGCGWQTDAGVTARGAWHTGEIRNPGQANCLEDGGLAADCQTFERVTGTEGNDAIFEILLTPVVEKVNLDTDAAGNPIYQASITDWSWNASIDMPDAFAIFTWELDIDQGNSEPQDLTTDGSVLGLIGGGYGAVTEAGNQGLTDGWPMFAPLSADRQNTANGTVGLNRSGDNSCFFEGQAVSDVAAGQLGLARPDDDDVDQGGPVGADDYVTDAGPLRNFDVSHANGAGLRFTVLEDIYGLSGNTFQGGLGYFVAEGTTTMQPGGGFGVAIDDMVLRWREFRLDPDTTSCAGGNCAVVELETTNFFEGNALMTVRVQENTPDAANDCNLDGTPDGTQDCDGNTVNDVVLRVKSEAERQGEIIFANQVSGSYYVATIPISSVYNVPGTLFIERNGTDFPTVTAEYEDNDIDGGAQDKPCPNDADPAKQGVVEVSTSVFFPAGLVTISNTRIDDNRASQDNDGIADTGETVDMYITIRNNIAGLDLTNVVARLASNDPDVDCIINPVITVGDINAESAVEGPDPFEWRVSDSALRTTEFQDLRADFTISVSSSEFDATIRPNELSLELDLNITGGGTVGAFTENFDTNGSLGQFTSMSLDLNKNSNTLANGFRCQYNDPDFVNSNSYGETQCYMADDFPPITGLPANTYDWHQHGTTQGDGGRGFVGTGSLHFGVHSGGDPDLDTASLGTLDAIRTTNPINLAHSSNGGTPELTFKHQISHVDSRSTNTPGGETVDRGVVQVQLADGLSNPVGVWTNVSPYINVYDVQTTDNFVDCLFDPTDDGNNEDSFFDPTDPDRRLGPSSMCFPEPVFTYLGDTDHRNPFSVAAIGRASDGPGLDGATGNGTWVQSTFSLQRYEGRRVRLRFVNSSIELGGVPTYEAGFQWNPVPFDDGWYIDDLRIDPTLSSAASVTADTANPALPGCPADNCGSVTANLAADPSAALGAPGEVVELDASGSSADQCVDGTLQYRFSIDGNGNNVGGDPQDTLLRDYTDNPIYVDAPSSTTAYVVDVRCSSDTTCAASSPLTVTVNCPSSGNLGGPFGETVEASNKTTYSWTTSQQIDAVKGDLISLRSNDNFNPSVTSCLANDTTTNSITDAATPASGGGFYYVIRGAAGAFCNVSGQYTTGSASEDPGRDSEINSDPDSCPQ